MDTRRRSVIVCATILTIGARLLPAQGLDTLTRRDLFVRGLSEEGDTAMVWRVLGAPVRVVQHQERNEDGALAVGLVL